MANALNIKDTKLSISDSSSHHIVKVIFGLNSHNKKLQDRYIKQEQDFDREREGWDRERNKLGQKLGGANTETQKLHNHALELIDEVKHLQIEKTC
jgi:hypothetical protein